MKILYIFLLAAVLLWCGMIVAAPLFHESAPNASVLCRMFFSPICHQEAERSFHIAGRPLPVCTRCTGIYAGFLAGLLVFPILWKKRRHPLSRRTFLFAAVPTATEFGLVRLDLMPDIGIVRTVTGCIIGAVVAACVAGAFLEIDRERQTRIKA